MKRLLEFDPYTQVSTWFEHDEMSDTTTLSYTQDVESTLDMNKTLANDDDYKKAGMKSGWWHYAHIPVVVQLKWKMEHGVDIYNKDHMPKILKLLADPDNLYLKTTSGRHI